MQLTYIEHPQFVKVVNAAGETVARCDMIEDTDKWQLSFYVANRRVERWIEQKDAARMVKAVALTGLLTAM